MKSWFYTFTAVHFFLTAISGVLLYFRPLDGREGWYSEKTKQVLVDFTMENFGDTLFLKTVIFPDFLLELF